MIEARSDSASSTTSKRRLRSSRPESAIGSLIRTRARTSSDTGGVVIRLERPDRRNALLDRGPPLHEQRFDGRERGRDVEDVVVADMTDPEHPGAELAVRARDRDPEAVAELEHEL